MAYTVNNFTGTLIATVEDGTIDNTTNLRFIGKNYACLLYTSPSPRDRTRSRMPSSA